MSLKKASIIVVLILLIDQISKIYIKTHFQLNEDITVFSWLKIAFVENDGMAWGTKLSDFFTFISDKSAKLFLTLFRIVAVTGIAFWKHRLLSSRRAILSPYYIAFSKLCIVCTTNKPTFEAFLIFFYLVGRNNFH